VGRGDGIGIFRRVTTHRVVALAGLHDGGVGDGAVGDAPRDRRLFFLLHLRALVLHLSLQDHLVLHHLPPSERLDLHRQGPLHHLLGEKSVRFVALAFARLGRPRRWIRRHQLHPRACLRVPNGLHSHRLEILHRDRASIDRTMLRRGAWKLRRIVMLNSRAGRWGPPAVLDPPCGPTKRPGGFDVRP